MCGAETIVWRRASRGGMKIWAVSSFFVAFAFVTLPASAQIRERVHIGLTGGAALRDTYRSYDSGFAKLRDESKAYIAGASVEVSLTKRIGLTFNPTYRRAGYTYSADFSTVLVQPNFPVTRLNSLRENRWEFPVMGRFYFTKPESRIRPFIAVGFSRRHNTGAITNEYVTFRQNGGAELSRLTWPAPRGVWGGVAGAGFLWQKGRWGCGPEMRYTLEQSRTVVFLPGERHRLDVLFHLRF